MKNKYLRLVVVLSALILSIGSLWAVPAYRGWQQRTLADGTTITVRQVGDEFYHYWETEDGKVAVEQPDGTFVVSNEQAPTGEQVVARRIAARNAKQPRRAKADYGAIQPTKLLVLLVNFSDKSMNSSHNKAFFQNLLNGSLPSVQDYFRTSSGGNYVPVFDVFGPYTLPNNMAYYGGNDSDGNDQHPDQMVVDACALAYADGCNFADYDTNSDGKVDNIYVIYAGYGEAAGAPANTIWPHSWEIYSQYVSGTLKYNNKYLGHYACSAELSGKSGTNSDGVGTFAHEFSHVIGLPDYYDTDYGTNSDNGVTPGEWTLMDQGSYNGSGQYPPLYSIYDKYFMGWTTPKFLAKDEKKNVTMTTTWDDAYQITGGSSRVACTNTNTVYYIENRQKSGYDQYLPGHGMILWKVTYNSTSWNNNNLNNTAGTLRYTIVPADGKTKNYGQATDPFPGSGRVKSYTKITGCEMTEITESGNNITFKFNGGVDKTKASYEFVASNCTVPEDGEVAINAALNVTITPNSGYTLADASCWTVEMGGVELTYGSGFTYNASTGAFSITSLTDDVVIMAEAKQIFTVTWSVNGSTTTANYIDGASLVMPSTPSDCSGSGGKKFVGWTAQSSISNGAKPADLFTSGSGITVTTNKTYYAVYATASEGGGGGTTDITLSPASDTSFPKDGITLSVSGGALDNGTDYRVYKGQTLTITSSVGAMTNIALTYSGASNDGGGWASSYTPNAATWTSPTASGEQARITQIVVTVNGGGTSYSDYSLICGTPCSNKPTMSFSTPTTVSKTTADASFTKTVNISGKGSGQTVAYSSSDETVATVTNSGVVTLQGKVGSTTITASVEASGTYCAASASYTLNVTAVPISVTLHYYYNDENHTANLNNQQSPYTLPTTGDYVADACDGDWTFAGWYGSEYAKSTTAPTYITQLNATGHAYAVYTTTVTESSAPARAKAEASGTKTFAFATIASANSWANSESYTTVEDAPVTITAQGGGNNGKWYTSGGGSWRMYSGGTVRITVEDGAVTSVTSSPSCSFTITDGVATFSPTARTDFTQIVVNYTTNGSGGGGGGSSSTTYYATTPECVTPCSQTPTMSFTNASVELTTDDATYTQAVTITGKGSGQTVAYSSSDETVATVNNSGVVTLKGKVGSTTITASVAADGDYCAASASYTLTVSAAPIDITLHYYYNDENHTANLNNQQSPYTLPTTGSYVADACDGDWTFAGWYGSEYAKSTTAPTYITQLNATGHAYAVYTTTETVSSAPVRKTAASVDDIMWSENWTGVTNNTTPSSPSASGSTVYGSATITYSWTDGGSKTQTYTADGPNGNENILVSKGSGAFTASGIPTGGATELTVTYAKSGGGTIAVSTTTSNVSVSDGTITISDANVTTFDLLFTNSASSNVRLDDIVVKVKTAGSGGGGGGGSTSVTYYATTPECVTGCTITPTMSFANETVTKTTDDEAYAQELTIENKGSGQTVAYSSSNETVATVSNLGGVTLNGVVGSTTITASVAADGEYCAASASYTITVEACALTGITLNTDNAKTVFLVGDQLTTDGVVVTANYSNCEDKIVEPDGFTYPGNITMEPGTKQVTAHYAEASATYDVTVVAPYTVTWKACGEVFDTQTYAPGATLVLPSSTPGGNAGKSFVGWTTTQHYTGTSAPPIISEGGEVNANATYYAVYK